MSSNNKKPEVKPIFLILAVVVLSFILLGAASLFKIESYRWILEATVLVSAVCAVYGILRSRSEYAYEMVDGNLIFKQKIGKGERYVFSLDTKNLRRMMTDAEAKAEAERRGIKAVPRYYAEATDGEVWGILYYDENENCEKILTFKPSQQILAILLRKGIDNGAKM